MKDQFDIWSFDFPGKGVHPVVLISHPDRCAHAAVVNVLFCTSQRQSRPPHSHEVMLTPEDGLSWEAFCDCSILYSIPSAALFQQRGHVGQHRRAALRGKVKDVFRLMASD